MYTQTAYCDNSLCTQAEVTVTVPVAGTIVKPLACYCPFCGQQSLVDEATHNRTLFINSLARDGFTLTVGMYERVYKMFRSQDAFTSLREYVGVMIFDDALPGEHKTKRDMGDVGVPLHHQEAVQKMAAVKLRDNAKRVEQ